MSKLSTVALCVLAVAASVACWWFVPRITLAAMALLMVVAFLTRH